MTGEPDFDPSCDFCLIVRGEAEAEVVCEGETWVAFFPVEPATPGHTLVIPRAHVRDLWKVPHSLEVDLMRAVVHVGRAIEEALSPAGMNLITSAGSAAEQSVFHLHLHLVPRWREDGFGQIWPTGSRWTDERIDKAAERVRAACGQAE
jgi:histidine triad (HIT) family protein